MFPFKPAAAPPPSGNGNFTKLQTFVGKLIVVVPYDDQVKSQFKRDDGSDVMQTRATVVPIQGGSHTDPRTGEETTWEAGEVYDVFISATRVRRQISELHVPVLGRLVKPENAWVLATPTEDDVTLAKKVLESVDIPDRQPSSKSTEDSNAVPW